jgi:hypothetical protein
MISLSHDNHLRTCQHCGVPYTWMRSPASLKMTYCGSLCEQANLGFSLEALERYQPPAAWERAEKQALAALKARTAEPAAA